MEKQEASLPELKSLDIEDLKWLLSLAGYFRDEQADINRFNILNQICQLAFIELYKKQLEKEEAEKAIMSAVTGIEKFSINVGGQESIYFDFTEKNQGEES